MCLQNGSELPGQRPGRISAAADGFRILARGKSAHASTPRLRADALPVGAWLYAACAEAWPSRRNRKE